MPFGVEFISADRARFRLWAPSARSVTLIVESPGTEGGLQVSLKDIGDGWRESVLEVAPGATYSYRIDNELNVPDPASRFNPRGPSGPSEIIDPEHFDWQDDSWRGRPWHEAVLYELHVGTFTPQGTFAAIVPRLDELADLGITVIELMPIGAFAGSRGWGYDGVLPFAPHSAYGRPDDLKRLVQAAHQRGISVVLDVIYNHFGPDGNYLPRYASSFFTARSHTPWGDAINFEGDAGRNVRRFFIENALYWLEEYHLDGLRLDAVHAIHDSSPRHFIDELADTIAAGPARHRHVHLILENGENEARRLMPAGDGPPTLLSKAQWNDDFHHPLHVLLTGETEGYYGDYAHAPLLQLGRVLAEGFAFQGEPFAFTGDKPRGESSAHLPPTAFINVLQTHDQVGNRALGERIAQLSSPESLRAAMTILLLAPQPPMLFMGEEYAAAQPFLYFCDHHGELAAAITVGRRGEFSGFRAFADESMRERIPDPNAPTTFQLSQLHWEERRISPHREWLEQTRTLLEIRSRHIVPLIPVIVPGAASYRVDASVLSVDWRTRTHGQLHLLANLGASVAPLAVADRGTAKDTTTWLLHSSAQRSGGDLAPWEVRFLMS
jgi:malto-oligosyltrehalose trehalohydrolase